MNKSNGAIRRTKPSGQNNNDQPLSPAALQVLSELTSRINLATSLGLSHQGERDIYKTLGYPKEVHSKDLIAQWRRQDIARAIVDRPVKATWQGEVFITEPNIEDESVLEKEYKELDKRLGLKSIFARADRLAHLGRYAVMLLGFDDSSKETWSQPVDTTGDRELKYVKVVSEHNADIKTWEKDPANERFGLPRLYEIKLQLPGEQGKTKSLDVHYTRVVHITLDLLEDEVEGEPHTITAFNRLKDLEKLIGGSAEMFWRGARPGYAGSAKDDYKIDSTTEGELMDQLKEYENDLRRFIVAEGVDISSLEQQISDPKGHVEVQLKMLSALTGIPLRILMGSERGELASDQDDSTWKLWVQTRRGETAEPSIIRPFVDRLLEYGILSEPKDGGYSVSWPNLFTMDESESADVAAKLSEALAKYSSDPMIEQNVPFEAFLKYFMNFKEDIVEQILEMRKAQLDEMIAEEDELESDAALIESEEQDESEEQEQ